MDRKTRQSPRHTPGRKVRTPAIRRAGRMACLMMTIKIVANSNQYKNVKKTPREFYSDSKLGQVQQKVYRLSRHMPDGKVETVR